MGSYYLYFDCKVIDYIKEPYGKYPMELQDSITLMEFNNFLPHLVNFLDDSLKENDDYIAYMT